MNLAFIIADNSGVAAWPRAGPLYANKCLPRTRRARSARGSHDAP